MYKYDVHAHTDEVSPCGRIGAKDLVKLYKDYDYDGIVITDHYHDRYFHSLGEVEWVEKINEYLSGYRLAKEAGHEHGVDVFLGMELRFTETKPNDFLVYGFDEQFLFDHPKLYEYSPEKFYNLKKEHDLLIYQAHPYRGKCSVISPKFLDGVEVYNGHPRHNSRNHLALEFAKKHDILMLSGSDSHRVQDVGRGGLLIEEKIQNTQGLISVLKGVEEENLLRSNS